MNFFLYLLLLSDFLCARALELAKTKKAKTGFPFLNALFPIACLFDLEIASGEKEMEDIHLSFPTISLDNSRR